MKKFLIATAALALTAGAASAEVTFSGVGKAGIASADGGDFDSYSSVKLAASASGTTDGGLEFGISASETSGDTYDSLGDFDGDSVIETKDGAFGGGANVYVSGSFGKITFAEDDYDFFDDANGSGDVKYEGTFGAATVGLIAAVEEGEYSASVGATLGGVNLSANVDTYNIWNVSASYTMGAITATVANRHVDGADDVQKLKLAYAADAMSASVQFKSDESWEVTAGYTAGALTIGLLANDDGAGADYQELTASYDLGGGMKVVGGANSGEDMFVGAEMSF